MKFPTAQSVLGRLIRLPLSLISPETVLQVRSGPVKGAKWIVGAGVHGCWLGTYERDIADRIAAEDLAGKLALDIGANAGYYTLLLSKKIGPGGKVIAFEPNPEAREFLEKHVALNQSMNVTIRGEALSDRVGQGGFSRGGNRSEGRISEGGELPIVLSTLDSLDVSPSLIKIDVEGEELKVLQGGRRLLGSHRPKIYLATHSDRLKEECTRFLQSLGFKVTSIAADELVAEAEEHK